MLHFHGNFSLPFEVSIFKKVKIVILFCYAMDVQRVASKRRLWNCIFSSEILCKLYKEFQMRTFLLSSICIKIYIIFRKNVAELFMSSLYRLISLLFSHTGMSTGCLMKKLTKAKDYGAETDHFLLHLDKTKMCLESCRIFQYSIF